MALSAAGINASPEVRQLRAFVAVAEGGSFTRAAKVLCISQSGLTKVIRDLESALKLTLFMRTTRTVALTADGAHFLPVARRLVRDFEHALSDLAQRAGGTGGTVRVAAGTAIAGTVLVPALATLRARRPDSFVQLRDDNSEGILRRVSHAEVDFAIGSLVGDTALLRSVPLLEAPLGALLPPSSAHVRGPIELKRLLALPLLRNASDTSIAALVSSECPELFGRAERCIEASQLATMIDLVHAGMGVAIVSALGASHPYANGLAFVPIKGLEVRRRVWLMRRADRGLSALAHEFLAAIVAAIKPAKFRRGVKMVLPTSIEPADF